MEEYRFDTRESFRTIAWILAIAGLGVPLAMLISAAVAGSRFGLVFFALMSPVLPVGFVVLWTVLWVQDGRTEYVLTPHAITILRRGAVRERIARDTIRVCVRSSGSVTLHLVDGTRRRLYYLAARADEIIDFLRELGYDVDGRGL